MQSGDRAFTARPNSFPTGPLTIRTVNLRTGTSTALPGGTRVDGTCAAAYSPDGRRIAYQVRDTIRVATAAGRILATFTAPHRMLAGKGAWTRDGTAIGLVTRAANGRRLVFVNADNGTQAAPSYLAIPGTIGLHLLGWRPDGAPLVVAYHAASDIHPATAALMDAMGSDVDHISVVALYPDRGPQSVLSLHDNILNIDIADDAITSGRTRPGGPAPLYLRSSGWYGVAATAFLLVAVALVCLIIRQLRRPIPRHPHHVLTLD